MSRLLVVLNMNIRFDAFILFLYSSFTLGSRCFRVFLHHQLLILMVIEIRGNFVQISIVLFCKFRIITLMDLLLCFP
jgi:hypothetical protein